MNATEAAPDSEVDRLARAAHDAFDAKLQPFAAGPYLNDWDTVSADLKDAWRAAAEAVIAAPASVSMAPAADPRCYRCGDARSSHESVSLGGPLICPIGVGSTFMHPHDPAMHKRDALRTAVERAGGKIIPRELTGLSRDVVWIDIDKLADVAKNLSGKG